MAFKDYANVFDYRDRIILDLADAEINKIANEVIKILKEMDEGLQATSDSGLENIWEEVCVQLQTDFSAMWDLYDEVITDMVEDSVRQLDEYALAAIQYSIDLEEDDTEYLYDIDSITKEITSRIYDIASNDTSKNVVDFIENEYVL